MILVEKFKSIRPGTKVTLMVENIFGHLVPVKGTIVGEIEQHGFISKRSGAWALYRIGQDWEPCYKVQVKPHCKKTVYSMRIGIEIHDVVIGW